MRWETIGEMIKEALGSRYNNKTVILRNGDQLEVPDETRALVIKDEERGVYRFWEAVYNQRLNKDGAVVIFDNTPSAQRWWGDLMKNYGGVRVGSSYILMFDGNTKPTVCPSQRGLFLDGRERED